MQKPGVPICPIVSHSGSPLYNLNILKVDVKYENNNVKNSTPFSNYIEDGKIMVPFDVTSYYTNIPITDMSNIFKDYVNNDDQFTRKTAIPQDKFLGLVNLVLPRTVGVAMGGRASSIITEIYMQAHEQTAISVALRPANVRK